MDHHGEGFQCLLKIFGSKNSDAKRKAGIFVRPEIRNLIKNEEFEQCKNSLELRAWTSFKQVVYNFLGRKRSEDYAQIVQEMLSAHQRLERRMLSKIHFFHSHMNFFPYHLGNVSNEDVKSFTKTFMTLKCVIKES